VFSVDAMTEAVLAAYREALRARTVKESSRI